MFSGTYYHVKDNKNRLRIPAKFSKELGTTYMIGKSAIDDEILSIYPLETFEEFSKNKYSPFNPKLELAATIFFGSYFEVSEDGQGRLQITDAIKQMVELDKDIVSVGAQTHVNLMSKKTYQRLYGKMSYAEALALLDEEYNKNNNKQ